MKMESPIPNTLSVFHLDPVSITEFDDSDLLEGGALSSLSSAGLKVKGQHVPMIRQSVLIGALLEQLCSLYESDTMKSEKLYYILCDQLSKLGIISPVAYLKEFTSVHTQYKQTLYNIIQSSLMKLDTKAAFNNNCDLPAMLNTGGHGSECNPVIVDSEKVFDFDTSRYRQEFMEDGRIGSGGYGNVFRAHSKIDGQDYAIKKIVLRNSLISERNEVLLREVRILAGLRHKNIVRYHSAWIEHAEDKIDSPQDLNKTENTSLHGGDFSSLVNKMMLPHNDSFLFRSSGDESHSFMPHECDPLQPYSRNDVKYDIEKNHKASSTKFWRDSSASETSVSVVNEKPKAQFYVSPEQSDDDFVFQDSHTNRKVTDASAKAKVQSPPKEVILTHGVRRDLDFHRVRSFIIKKDDTNGDFEKYFKSARTRSHNALEDYDKPTKAEIAAIVPRKFKSFSYSALGRSNLVLYIQMELCQTSLKHWLSLRNKNLLLNKESFHEGTSLLIMKQIASALVFIHSKDLIHRDVKPPNIFLNGFNKPHVLLGDFGLAKSGFMVSKHGDETSNNGLQSDPLSLRRLDSHTSGVGTTTYAAPEQLTAEIYDEKVDMYSFGIVIYELWKPFGTVMERARHIKQLRDQIIPSCFILKFPQLGKLVNSLLEHDPKLRPSSEEIFQGDFFEKSKEKIIEEQTERIEILEKENRELKIFNKKLQRLLNSKYPPP